MLAYMMYNRIPLPSSKHSQHKHGSEPCKAVGNKSAEPLAKDFFSIKHQSYAKLSINLN